MRDVGEAATGEVDGELGCPAKAVQKSQCHSERKKGRTSYSKF